MGCESTLRIGNAITYTATWGLLFYHIQVQLRRATVKIINTEEKGKQLRIC